MKRSFIAFFFGFGSGVVVTYLVSTYLKLGVIPPFFLQEMTFIAILGLILAGTSLGRKCVRNTLNRSYAKPFRSQIPL